MDIESTHNSVKLMQWDLENSDSQALRQLLDNLNDSDWLFLNSNHDSFLEQNLLNNIQGQIIDYEEFDFLWLMGHGFDFPSLTAQPLLAGHINWVAKVSLIKKIQRDNIYILEDNYKLINYLITNKIVYKTKLIKSKKNEHTKNYNKTFCSKKILAIVPHYNCNQWLDYCLFSLVNQTLRLTDIIVVDDNSSKLPKSICVNYPQVTLLSSKYKVGPYQIIQSVINNTNYDYYLFQDADDWSMIDRLRISMELMDKMEADMVGTQEYLIDEINDQIIPIVYPLNVNQALEKEPGHPLSHPTSLIKRSALLRVNGFANALLYGADTEFLLRAHFHLKIYNSPEFGYFRRRRNNSLTNSPITGLNSPHRKKLLQTLKAIAYNNNKMIKQGRLPSTTPLVSKPCVKFERV